RRHTRFSRDWSSDVCSSDLAMDDFEKAIRLYEKNYDMSSMSASEWCKKGIGLCNIKSYEEAIGAFNKALELNPVNGKALYNKGRSEERRVGKECRYRREAAQ